MFRRQFPSSSDPLAMKRKQYSLEQGVTALKQVEQDPPLVDPVRRFLSWIYDFQFPDSAPQN